MRIVGIAVVALFHFLAAAVAAAHLHILTITQLQVRVSNLLSLLEAVPQAIAQAVLEQAHQV